jgi:diacylglycerol O-acyltransferase / wax synthase
MTQREKMSAVDTAWLRMDHPSNLMMIVGIMVFANRTDFERLRRTLESRLTGRFRRFRQRVHQDPTGAWWEDDPDFDLGNHLVRRALPAPAGKEELQDLSSELAAEPLHASRPLWRFDFIENYDGGSALIARFHHCIADGIALVGVMLSMTDLDADAPPPEVPPPREASRAAEDPWLALLDPMTQAAMAAYGMTTRFWTGYLNLLMQPDLALKLGRDGIGFATELGKLLAMSDDSPTRLKGHAGTDKRVAWCDPIPLEEVKALGKALGCSVNDILLSAVAGALRGYLTGRGDSVEGVEIRALVPVNLRSESDAGTLGNRFGLVTLLLPLHERNPFARLFEVRKRMLEMKGSYQAPLTLLLLGLAGIAPKLVQEKFLDMLANKASAVMTNVPGPRQPLYLAGSRIDQIMFWVPQSGDIGLGVSILSYNNAVQFGLITDRRLLPDPETVIPLFRSEFEKMLTALMLHDWGTPLDPVALEQALAAELAPAPKKPVAPRKSAVAGRRARHADREKPATRVPKRFRVL